MLAIVLAFSAAGCQGQSDEQPAIPDDEPEAEIGQPLPGTFVTTRGHAACQDESSFHAMMALVSEGNLEAVQEVVDRREETGCFMLNPDVEVEVVAWYEFFVEIQPIGTTTSVWAVSEAVRRMEGEESSQSNEPRGG